MNKTNEKDNNDKYKIKDKERYQQKDKEKDNKGLKLNRHPSFHCFSSLNMHI